jgi:hypothetical protein
MTTCPKCSAGLSHFRIETEREEPIGAMQSKIITTVQTGLRCLSCFHLAEGAMMQTNTLVEG